MIRTYRGLGLAIVLLVGLGLVSYLLNRPWLWMATLLLWLVAAGWGLRRLSEAAWSDTGTGRGRFFFLARPSGLGSAGRPGLDTGFPGSIVVKQEPGEPGTPADVEAYLPETAWTSARKRPNRSQDRPGSA